MRGGRTRTVSFLPDNAKVHTNKCNKMIGMSRRATAFVGRKMGGKLDQNDQVLRRRRRLLVIKRL